MVIQYCLALLVASRIQDHRDSMDLLECLLSLCIYRTLDLTAMSQMLYATAERNESSLQAAILFAPESGALNQLRYLWMMLHWKPSWVKISGQIWWSVVAGQQRLHLTLTSSKNGQIKLTQNLSRQHSKSFM